CSAIGGGGGEPGIPEAPLCGDDQDPLSDQCIPTDPAFLLGLGETLCEANPSPDPLTLALCDAIGGGGEPGVPELPLCGEGQDPVDDQCIPSDPSFLLGIGETLCSANPSPDPVTQQLCAVVGGGDPGEPGTPGLCEDGQDPLTDQCLPSNPDFLLGLGETLCNANPSPDPVTGSICGAIGGDPGSPGAPGLCEDGQDPVEDSCVPTDPTFLLGLGQTLCDANPSPDPVTQGICGALTGGETPAPGSLPGLCADGEDPLADQCVPSDPTVLFGLPDTLCANNPSPGDPLTDALCGFGA
ncbi:MAG: hypothetical protein ACX94A_08635, partial [Algiphilus sp.]